MTYNPHLEESDFENIFVKYDIRNTGNFCYNDFLRHFVLSLRPPENSLLARKKLQKARLSVSTIKVSVIRINQKVNYDNQIFMI